MFDRDPKKVSKTERDKLTYYDRISARQLMELDLDDLIIERPIITLLQRAKCLKELQIIDALRHPEHIASALQGEHVGTIIYQD